VPVFQVPRRPAGWWPPRGAGGGAGASAHTCSLVRCEVLKEFALEAGGHAHGGFVPLAAAFAGQLDDDADPIALVAFTGDDPLDGQVSMRWVMAAGVSPVPLGKVTGAEPVGLAHGQEVLERRPVGAADAEFRELTAEGDVHAAVEAARAVTTFPGAGLYGTYIVLLIVCSLAMT
jgi:hypothetical protein